MAAIQLVVRPVEQTSGSSERQRIESLVFERPPTTSASQLLSKSSGGRRIITSLERRSTSKPMAQPVSGWCGRRRSRDCSWCSATMARHERRQREQGRAAPLAGSIRHKSILASPSVPVLFVLLGFFVIANINCDSVGSTNAEDSSPSSSTFASLSSSKPSSVGAGGDGEPNVGHNSISQADKELEALEQQQRAAVSALAATSATKQKFDPLNVLREIYLDHDSKVTMFLPDESTVQKFHPNGRYGRRSVDNFAEPHTELGKLVLDDQVDTSQVSISSPMVADRDGGGHSSGSLRTILRELTRSARLAKARRSDPQSVYPAAATAQKRQQQPTRQARASGTESPTNQRQLVDADLGKLLNCNYSGISNLYWCDLTGSAGGAS